MGGRVTILVFGEVDTLVGLRSGIIRAFARIGEPQATALQLGVFVTYYLPDRPPTINGMAEPLNVPMAAITRALDRLGEFDPVRRIIELNDRRRVRVQRTIESAAVFLEVCAAVARAAVGGHSDVLGSNVRRRV